MASSENLLAMEPWAFRPAFADSWFSEALARDTETLTRALQKSMMANNADHNVLGNENDMVMPMFSHQETPVATTSVQTPTVSGGSESETVVSVAKRQRNPVSGKITKRKSRASKKTTTTFITADPANFRQMVQQVTGIRFNGGVNGHMPVSQVLKPEPQRLPVVSRMQHQPSGCLPTLDTSAFLLDHNNNNNGNSNGFQQHQMVSPTSSNVVVQQVAPPVSTVADDGGWAAGFDFESFSGFPTLESGKVM